MEGWGAVRLPHAPAPPPPCAHALAEDAPCAIWTHPPARPNPPTHGFPNNCIRRVTHSPRSVASSWCVKAEKSHPPPRQCLASRDDVSRPTSICCSLAHHNHFPKPSQLASLAMMSSTLYPFLPGSVAHLSQTHPPSRVLTIASSRGPMSVRRAGGECSIRDQSAPILANLTPPFINPSMRNGPTRWWTFSPPCFLSDCFCERPAWTPTDRDQQAPHPSPDRSGR